MAHQSKLIEEDIDSYLKLHEKKDVLRFITCGSVDDGKSTLIGRLLFESKMIFEDHLEALKRDSKDFGANGENLDLALVVDGLKAEREQGITIDVAYRYFSTDKRKFIIADTPGHEQYTRNMATGASTADLAIVIIDARKGILTQTRRHSFIASMMGIKHILLAVNKMDLVSYKKEIFDKIKNDYIKMSKSLGFETIEPIPVSAINGDNIIEESSNMPWYKGGSLMEYLENIPIVVKNIDKEFSMPVQLVNRPNSDFRGYSGRIASGRVKVGDNIQIMPSDKTTKLKEIVTYDGNLEIAIEQDSVTLVLEDEIDISRGDVILGADNSFEISNQFEVQLLWMSEKPMVSSRQYILQLGTSEIFAMPAKLKYKIDIESFKKDVGDVLGLNEIGVCNISLDRKIVFKPYNKNRVMGGFILIDKITKQTVAAGMINHALRRSNNLTEHKFKIDINHRAEIKRQKPLVLWLTGISGAGKSTIADILEQKLHYMGKHTILLDGDNIRQGLNKDLNFTEQGRAENIRRIAEVSKLMSEAGLITIVSFISPFTAERETAKDIIGSDMFVEIFVDTALCVAEKRDVKGLYKKAREGEIPNFTGIDSPYQKPKSPDMHLDTSNYNAEELADKIIAHITKE